MSSYITPKKMFDPSPLSIYDLFGRSTFQIPVYQRPYSWTKDEAREFFEDIKENFFNRTELFVGTIYIKESNLNRDIYIDYEVIDGQQRFITLSLILLNLYVILKQIDKNEELDVILHDLKNTLWKKGNSVFRLLVSSSIENRVLKKLFDIAFQSSLSYKRQLDYLYTNKESNVIEKKIIDVARYLYNQFERLIKDDVTKAETIVQFILYKIWVISIVVKESNQQVFNIFESINSKGKQLDEIDLIKTYIFSQIPSGDGVNDSQIYLERWGQLIIKTKDNLEDYLWIYIKSFIKYYSGNVNLEIFKNLIKNEELNGFYHIPKGLPSYFIFEALIDDLIYKLDCYIALNDVESFKSIVTNDKNVLLQFQIFNFQKYEHCRPLFLKAIYEFMQSSQDVKEKQKLSEIFKYSNSFMVESQSLIGKSSKSAIPIFKNIMAVNYNLPRLNFDSIKNRVIKELRAQGIDRNEIKKRLSVLNGNSDSIGKILLIIAQSYHGDSLSIDKANHFFNHEKLVIKHLLPQRPKKFDDFIYGRRKIDNNENNDLLELKHNADFPNEVYDGMPYTEFEDLVLSKLGNLELLEEDLSNNFVPNMKFYRNILERQDELIDKILRSNLFYVLESLDQKTKINGEFVFSSPKLLDLSKPASSTNQKFKLISIFGKKIPVNGMVDTIEKVFCELYNHNPQNFVNLQSLGTQKNPFISRYQNDLRSPRKIQNSPWFIETHNNNRSNVMRITRALELYNISLDELEIFCE